MTLRQIQYIIAVKRMGSLNSAAKSLFISQSTLSFAIKDLERELGFQIFERTRTGMLPTERGIPFLKKAHEALSAFSALETMIPDVRDETAPLRIATVQSSFLASAFQRFAAEMERRPGQLRLKYKQFDTGEVIDEMTGGKYDLGFVYATDRQEQVWQQEFSARGLEARRIGTFEICVIFSESDPLARRACVSLSELSDYTFVYGGDDGLSIFSNLADYSALNFSLNEHRRYIDVQDTQLLNALLRCPRRFTIGHRTDFPPYAAGLSYVPLRDPQFVYLLMLRLRNSAISSSSDRLVEQLLQSAP